MGAGKTSIGRRLARALAAPFADADEEIVAAAGMSIPDIFALYGEPRFRELERRVVARLLDGRPWCWRWAAAPSSTRRRGPG